jgi:hypothetical protein
VGLVTGCFLFVYLFANRVVCTLALPSPFFHHMRHNVNVNMISCRIIIQFSSYKRAQFIITADSAKRLTKAVRRRPHEPSAVSLYRVALLIRPRRFTNGVGRRSMDSIGLISIRLYALYSLAETEKAWIPLQSSGPVGVGERMFYLLSQGPCSHRFDSYQEISRN